MVEIKVFKKIWKYLRKYFFFFTKNRFFYIIVLEEVL